MAFILPNFSRFSAAMDALVKETHGQGDAKNGD
jgi:hypothetical protein